MHDGLAGFDPLALVHDGSGPSVEETQEHEENERMLLSQKPMRRIAKTQVPARIQTYDRVPYRDEVVATYAGDHLGLVSQIVRRFNTGAVSLLNVSVGTGLVLARYDLSRNEVKTLSMLLAS